MAIDTPAVLGSASLSGNSYDIYGSNDRAKEYLRGGINGTDFLDLGQSDQNRHLVQAYRLLSRQSWKSGFPVQADDTVPLGIEFAQYEMAVLLVEDPDLFSEPGTGSNERLLKAGSAQIEFFSRDTGKLFPTQVMDLIKPYLGSRVAIITPTVSGSNVAKSTSTLDHLLTEPL